MAEHSAVNRRVGGSSPLHGAIKIIRNEQYEESVSEDAKLTNYANEYRCEQLDEVMRSLS